MHIEGACAFQKTQLVDAIVQARVGDALRVASWMLHIGVTSDGLQAVCSEAMQVIGRGFRSDPDSIDQVVAADATVSNILTLVDSTTLTSLLTVRYHSLLKQHSTALWGNSGSEFIRRRAALADELGGRTRRRHLGLARGAGRHAFVEHRLRVSDRRAAESVRPASMRGERRLRLVALALLLVALATMAVARYS